MPLCLSLSLAGRWTPCDTTAINGKFRFRAGVSMHQMLSHPPLSSCVSTGVRSPSQPRIRLRAMTLTPVFQACRPLWLGSFSTCKHRGI
ncbi:hypothetical protein D3C72_1776570 [compost metagenome]